MFLLMFEVSLIVNMPRHLIKRILLFYVKTNDYFFQVINKSYMKGHIISRYKKDKTGKSTERLS